jgi:hypothetical protein
LTVTKEPVFFAAIVAVVSPGCSLPYAWLSHRNRSIVWQTKALMHFSECGFFEGLGLFNLMALGLDTVVWFADRCHHAAVESADRLSVPAGEGKVNARTALGTVVVVCGTIVITPGR